MSRVLLGVGASIAAYKAVSLARLFLTAGHDVWAIPSPASLSFVGRATWEGLCGHPAQSDVFEGAVGIDHVELGKSADLVVLAPATADLIARAACGLANDMLTNVLLASRAPLLVAPAMHSQMLTHPATQANISLLRSRGAVVMEPGVGRLAGEDSGVGRLPEPEEIFRVGLDLLRGVNGGVTHA